MDAPDYTALAALLETYRKNRKNVPEDLLKTKYKEGWEKLKARIAEEAERVARQHALHDLVFYRDDFQESGVADRISEAYTAGGYPQRLGRALFKNMDLDEFRIILDGFRETVEGIHKNYISNRESEETA